MDFSNIKLGAERNVSSLSPILMFLFIRARWGSPSFKRKPCSETCSILFVSEGVNTAWTAIISNLHRRPSKYPMAWSVPNCVGPKVPKDYMVFRWCTYQGKFAMLHPMVCQPRGRTSSRAVCVSSNIRSTKRNAHFWHRKRFRVLIFNITHGRSGTVLLKSMQTSIINQLQLNGRSEDAQSFFDHVIFCTNVTYASGRYKSGVFPDNRSSN